MMAAKSSFGQAFHAAYDAARKADPTGLNLVSLAELRAALGVDREAFDAGLYQLRKLGRYVLHTEDGRHRRATPEQVAAGITEGLGPYVRTFVHVARRDGGGW